MVLAVATVSGCTQIDENPQWDPQADYPQWAYDAPYYYRPTEDLKAAETVGDGIPIYYSRSEYFFIKHPIGYQLNGVPRMAVWSSDDEGQNWLKAGYYGVEQSHFRFRAEADGAYWIRFVGPGQGTSEVPPGVPHRIYVVDRKAPTIVLSVSPPPWQDEEKTIPHIYHVGDSVVIYWGVSDANLKDGSVKLSACFAEFPHNLVWSRWPKALGSGGSETIEIPPEAARDGGLRLRIEATDKAGNIGMALTEVMRVVGGPASPTVGPATRPAGPLEPLPAEGDLKLKPGWPMTGQMIRGGTSMMLKWMPRTAADYDALRLEFSANDGRSWRAVATGFKFGQPVKWTVPTITSKNCRLRIAAVKGIDPSGQEAKVMLALTGRFTVDTVVPGTKLGPKDILPDK